MGKTDLLENLMQVAPLKLIVHKSAEALGEEVNAALVEARKRLTNHIHLLLLMLDMKRILFLLIIPAQDSVPVKVRV